MLVRSTMMPLGSPAPDFSLKDTEGNTITKDDFSDTPLLVMFICNHCPFVRHIRNELLGLVQEYQQKGVGVVGINANIHPDYPEDSYAKMQEYALNYGYTFRYLADEGQQVARAYTASCTPDFFLFDQDHNLYYRGQMDDSRPSNQVPVTGKDLRGALDSLLAGRDAPADQKPSMGCSIKWREGNEPDYYQEQRKSA